MKKEVFVILAIVLVAFLIIFFSGDPQKLINGNILKDFNNKEIILSGNEILEIKDSDYVFNNNIKLKDPTYHLLDSEMKQFLVDDVLTMTDSLTMANSLEARQPFLDTKLVSFVYSLPIKMRYNKGILKNTIGKSLPGYITKRKKEGFFMPIDTIIMNNLSFFKNFLFNNNSGIFNEWYIEKLFRNFNYSS